MKPPRVQTKWCKAYINRLLWVINALIKITKAAEVLNKRYLHEINLSRSPQLGKFDFLCMLTSSWTHTYLCYFCFCGSVWPAGGWKARQPCLPLLDSDSLSGILLWWRWIEGLCHYYCYVITDCFLRKRLPAAWRRRVEGSLGCLWALSWCTISLATLWSLIDWLLRFGWQSDVIVIISYLSR